MKTVLIVGGGITGLSTAYELEKKFKGEQDKVQILLAESSAQLGGKIRTVNQHEFIMETGADSIVSRKFDSSLLKELNLEKDVVYNDVGTSYLYTEGDLKQIPAEAVFGIPAGIEALVESELISAEGKVEALKDYYVNDKKFTKTDSIGEFLDYYLGKEIVERQIAPVLSGVYSGDLYNLTIASTLPYLLDYKNEYGSILKGIEANRNQFLGNNNKKFLSFTNGMQAMIEALEKQLENTQILLSHKVNHIKKVDQCYSITFENDEVITADYVVLSVPHNAAKKMFQDEEIEKLFSKLKMNSLISVYLGFDVSDDLLPENGTGFITANGHDLNCGACTWTSRKWKHTSKNGNLLVRLFYKSSHPNFSDIKNLPEKELLNLAMSDIEKSLKLRAEPVVSEITKWNDLMPTYQLTHPEIVRTIENYLHEKYSGIILAGSSYYGAGIPDCIENGRHAAKKIMNAI